MSGKYLLIFAWNHVCFIFFLKTNVHAGRERNRLAVGNKQLFFLKKVKKKEKKL